MAEQGPSNSEDDAHHARFGRFKVRLPKSRTLRVGLGIALCAGGIVGFLPIVGFWMLPLGIIVLAVDVPAARRLRLWADRKWGKRKEKEAG